MQKIGPGLYVDAEAALHIDARELCAAQGIPPTPHNLTQIYIAAAEAADGGLFTLAEINEP
jgi:hypothetical protein